MFVLFSSDLFLVFLRKQTKAEFTFSPEHEIMAFITPPIYKYVHKQNMGYFLFIVVLLNQGKKPLFIKYQSYLF